MGRMVVTYYKIMDWDFTGVEILFAPKKKKSITLVNFEKNNDELDIGENQTETFNIPDEIIPSLIQAYQEKGYTTFLAPETEDDDCGKEFDEFKQEIEEAIEQYGADHIDVTRDNNDGIIYGHYHSHTTSFPVTEEYAKDMMSDEEIKTFCDERNIGYSL